MALIAVMYFALVLMLFHPLPLPRRAAALELLFTITTRKPSLGKMAADILVLINEHRTALGLSKLVTSDAATKQATLHSVDMGQWRLGFRP